MTKGQLRCIGTPQHLRQRHGVGYQVTLTTKEMVSGISPHLGRCPSVVVKNMYGCAEFDCGDAVENSYNKTAPSSLPTPRHAAVRT